MNMQKKCLSCNSLRKTDQKKCVCGDYSFELSSTNLMFASLNKYSGQKNKETFVPEKTLLPEASSVIPDFLYEEVQRLTRGKMQLEELVAPRNCFRNAAAIAYLLNRVTPVLYVEGEAGLSDFLPFYTTIHAWCYLPKLDIHIDPTWEFFANENMFNSAKYYPVVQGVPKQITKAGYKFNSSLDIYTQWLNDKKYK